MDDHIKIEELTESLKKYINTRYELMVLKATEKASNIGAELISALLIVKLASLALLILSLALAFYISSSNGDTYSGFLIVGGVYFIIMLLLIGFRKSLLKKPFRDIIIKAMFKQDL